MKGVVCSVVVCEHPSTGAGLKWINPRITRSPHTKYDRINCFLIHYHHIWKTWPFKCICARYVRVHECVFTWMCDIERSFAGESDWLCSVIDTQSFVNQSSVQSVLKRLLQMEPCCGFKTIEEERKSLPFVAPCVSLSVSHLSLSLSCFLSRSLALSLTRSVTCSHSLSFFVRLSFSVSLSPSRSLSLSKLNWIQLLCQHGREKKSYCQIITDNKIIWITTQNN